MTDQSNTDAVKAEISRLRKEMRRWQGVIDRRRGAISHAERDILEARRMKVDAMHRIIDLGGVVSVQQYRGRA